MRFASHGVVIVRLIRSLRYPCRRVAALVQLGGERREFLLQGDVQRLRICRRRCASMSWETAEWWLGLCESPAWRTFVAAANGDCLVGRRFRHFPFRKIR